MSFILDALKKSETDRQRQGGPALFEVKVAAPRSVLPTWAIAIAVLFAANLGVVLWLVLRHNSAPAETALPQAASNASAPAPGTPTAPPAAVVPAPGPAAPPASAPSNAAATASEPSTTASASPPPRPAAEPALNSDDYAPAAEPAPPSGTSRVQRGTEAGVPLYQQLAAAPGNQIPQLRLDLHAYAEKAEDRWVLVNMHKVHEGDTLPEGVRVERITPDGAVLSWHGQQFMLPRE